MAEYLKESFWVLFLPSGKSCTSYYPSLNIAASLITPFYWPNGWPWLFTNFPSLRDCYSNLRLLIRTSILCGQHFLSWILRLEKCREQWARSQKTWFCSLLGYNVILDHSPSLGSDSPMCNRWGWMWWAVQSLFLSWCSRIYFLSNQNSAG